MSENPAARKAINISTLIVLLVFTAALALILLFVAVGMDALPAKDDGGPHLRLFFLIGSWALCGTVAVGGWSMLSIFSEESGRARHPEKADLASRSSVTPPATWPRTGRSSSGQKRSGCTDDASASRRNTCLAFSVALSRIVTGFDYSAWTAPLDQTGYKAFIAQAQAAEQEPEPAGPDTSSSQTSFYAAIGGGVIGLIFLTLALANWSIGNGAFLSVSGLVVAAGLIAGAIYLLSRNGARFRHRWQLFYRATQFARDNELDFAVQKPMPDYDGMLFRMRGDEHETYYAFSKPNPPHHRGRSGSAYSHHQQAGTRDRCRPEREPAAKAHQHLRLHRHRTPGARTAAHGTALQRQGQ